MIQNLVSVIKSPQKLGLAAETLHLMNYIIIIPILFYKVQNVASP